ncbi:MAG: hypothetical protein FD152_761, partial [Xanthobacteraceae bacterium]
QQDRVRAVGGHLRGKIDGRTIGLPEAAKTEHIVECKSAKDESFKEVRKKGVKEGKPDHYATFQFYMHATGVDRVLYMMTNKNDEDLHLERVPYDAEFALRLVARIERIVSAQEPPGRVCTKPDDFRGRFCRQKEVWTATPGGIAPGGPSPCRWTSRPKGARRTSTSRACWPVTRCWPPTPKQKPSPIGAPTDPHGSTGQRRQYDIRGV